MTEFRAQLQKPLQGLARFLGLQSQGSLQVNWTPNMVPVYDLSDWIGPPVTDQGRSTTIAQNGTFDAFTVPDGETWQIYALGCLITPAANAHTNSYIRLLRFGTTNGIVIGPTVLQNQFVTATSFQYMHRASIESGYCIYPRKLFLSGGDAVSVRLQGGAAAGNNEVRLMWQYQNLTL